MYKTNYTVVLICDICGSKSLTWKVELSPTQARIQARVMEWHKEMLDGKALDICGECWVELYGTGQERG